MKYFKCQNYILLSFSVFCFLFAVRWERQDKEAKAFKKLFLKAIRLHQATIIRNCIQTVEADTMKKGNITEEFTQWLVWAEQKVSWYDPLVNGPGPLLNDHHKTHLFKKFLKEWQ